MHEIKLRVEVMWPLASGACGALPLVGGVCWVSLQERRATMQVMLPKDVTAGKMGCNSSNSNLISSPSHPPSHHLLRIIIVL